MTDFVNTLMEMRNGAVAADCSRKLSELMDAVLETGKTGALTLTVRIKPSRFEQMRVTEVELTHACKAAKPEHDAGRSIFFVTKERMLTRNDPGQLDFGWAEPTAPAVCESVEIETEMEDEIND